MGRIRVFTAVDVGLAIRSKAVALQQRLGECGAAVNWMTPDDFHVTLNFLGDVDDRDLHGVCRAVGEVCRGESPFRLAVAGVGAFPNPRRPKVLWAGVADGGEVLQRVYAACEPKFIALGVYRREERGYTPHLTLGRVRDEADGQTVAAELPKFADWQGGDMFVQELLVFTSELRRDGPVYSVIGRAPLTGR